MNVRCINVWIKKKNYENVRSQFLCLSRMKQVSYVQREYVCQTKCTQLATVRAIYLQLRAEWIRMADKLNIIYSLFTPSGMKSALAKRLCVCLYFFYSFILCLHFSMPCSNKCWFEKKPILFVFCQCNNGQNTTKL